MTEPLANYSRYGYGACFEGAPYCTPEFMDREYQEKVEKAKAAGDDVKKVRRPRVDGKYMAWAFFLGFNDEEESDPDIVILNMSNPLAKELRTLIDSRDYKVSEFPMNYDITINIKNAGTTNAEYKVVPDRKDRELTDHEKEEFEKVTPIDQVWERIKSKAQEKWEANGKAPAESSGGGIDYPKDDINPDDIPF